MLPGSPSQVREKGSAFGMAEQSGCLIHNQLTRPADSPHAVPHMPGDHVNGQWLELGYEISDLEDDERLIEGDVGRSCEHAAAERSTDEAVEAGRETLINLRGCLRQDCAQVAEQRCRVGVGC